VSAIKPPSVVPPRPVLLPDDASASAGALAVITRHPDLSQGYFGKIPKAFASRFS